MSETLLKGIIKDLKQTQKHTHIYIKMAYAKMLSLDFSFSRATPFEKKPGLGWRMKHILYGETRSSLLQLF